MRARRFPRADYGSLTPYDPGRSPVEVDLSDNTNLWGPHPAAADFLGKSLPETLTRYPSPYASRLKAAVAQKLGVEAENVTTGCGSDDLLDSAFRASALPPGRITFPDPTFSMVGSFARMNGMEALPIPWSEAEEDPGALLSGDPDLVYLCRPNNPTGHSTDRVWMLELLEGAGDDGPLVVLDEAYADFGAEHFLSEAPGHRRLLVLRTFSKLYGLAGLRVGFGVGHRSVIAEVEKSRGPYKVTGVSEAGAVLAMDDRSGWTEKVALETRRNRERLGKELEKRGMAPLPSQANFLLIPLGPGLGRGSPGGSSRGGRTDQRGGAREIDAGLRARGVGVRPFTGLPGLGDALRVTIGPWPLMARFLDALDSVIQEGENAR